MDEKYFISIDFNRHLKNKAVYTSRSRVRVGRGSDDKDSPKHLGRSSNAKTARNAEKAKCDGPTDRPTDRQTDGQSGL